ncbi:ferric-chelate reductase 1 [Plakobranchus ocellatus]|uniref:Ferric-chelate reductase 1 n=1 Tax=Plakobranchus ocellatus TaxID=259542 RepID=A0AAV4CZE0_9GAST|nr:ferric-chelate reductase 1 [Plakobranchus ocellatus]
MSDYKGSVKDGTLACTFNRKLSYPREPRVFDLHEPYYLMVANGEAVSGNKFPHSYETLPLVSAEKVDVRKISMARKGMGRLYPMVKTHGTAMTLAWMFFASIGVFISRHGRAMFNYSRPRNLLVWYHIHRFCMAMAAFLTCAGFVLILVESQGYSQISHTPDNRYRALHPPLGMLLVILTMVNPLMALFRPEQSSPSRPTFKWAHWGIGMFAWILAIALLATGLDLPKSQADLISVYVVFAFAGYQLVVEMLVRVVPYCLGSILALCVESSCSRNKNSFDLHMANFSTDEVPSVTGSGIAPDKEVAARQTESSERRENIIKSSILVLHMLLSAFFAVAVLYFLLRKPVQYVTSGNNENGGNPEQSYAVVG